METVSDLTEADVIAVLHQVAVAHLKSQKASPSDSEAMQVDVAAIQTQDTPSLVDFLRSCVSYNTSAPALRLALKKNLDDVEEALAVLQVLESWIRKWGEAEDEFGIFLTSSSASRNCSTQQLPELSKVLLPLRVMKMYLIGPLPRSYLSLKRS